MHKIIKKLVLASISLLLAIITFTGVTFAWLSINSDAWVEGMQIQATAGKGFLVSVDGYNYHNNLSKEDIMKAIIIKYRKSYSINYFGNLCDENNREIKESEIEKIFEDIRLDHCTSYNTNNLELTNVFGTKIDVTKGEYIEFDIHFKATGDQTNKTIDIYLNGKDKVLHQDTQEYDVNPSKLSSEVDGIELLAKLTTYDKESGEALEKQRKDILKVKSANAVRLGIMNQQSEISILELTDEYDLGSYATNISEYLDSKNELYDENIVYDPAYDANKNAMFTYTSQTAEQLTAIDYKKMPKTIKQLLDSDGNNTVRICSLTKEDSTQTATFKLWLEGWDADCIDGLSKSISVQLSFVQQ